MSLHLTVRDQALLAGGEGEGAALAMRVLVRTAEAMGAAALLDIVSAHVDGCLFHGRAGLDFARALVDGGAAAVVHTTLNVASLDLLHPEMVHADPEVVVGARALMDAYVELGCSPTWTCAPYQLATRPAFGDQIAWAESNAIVFANSVLGARTERYGDFLDICAAVTGRAPAVGLHLDEGRLATMVLSVGPVADLFHGDAVYPLLGHILGQVAGSGVAAIVGLPADTSEDRLKAVGAAAASSGAVGMFHAVGITPEASDLATATGGVEVPVVEIDRAALDLAVAELSTAAGDRVDAVSLGTPHYSAAEMRRLAALLDGRRLAVPLYVNTSRGVLSGVPEVAEVLSTAGVRIVTDTCTYITPILEPDVAVVMTDSAKWAYYAPANLGVSVVFGSVEACVDAAVTGQAPAEMVMIEATHLVTGQAEGPILFLEAPVSFWGGVDPDTGEIRDHRHPQAGTSVTGTFLALPLGRGSSSSSTVLAEMIRLGTAPCAIVLAHRDPILVLGAVVASELYGRVMPLVLVSASDLERLSSCGRASVEPDGRIAVRT